MAHGTLEWTGKLHPPRAIASSSLPCSCRSYQHHCSQRAHRDPRQHQTPGCHSLRPHVALKGWQKSQNGHRKQRFLIQEHACRNSGTEDVIPNLCHKAVILGLTKTHATSYDPNRLIAGSCFSCTQCPKKILKVEAQDQTWPPEAGDPA